MNFWIVIANLARSRRVIVPTLLIGLSLGAAAWFMAPTRYVSSATMVLTTTEFGGTESRDPATPTELVNPLLTFSESLRTSADMLIWSMTSDEVTRVLDPDGRVEVTVNDGRSNPDLLGFNGPIVYVSAESTDPERARIAVDMASEMMRESLFEWQDEMRAPSSTYITLVDVVPTTASQPEYGFRLKLAALALMGGIFLSMAAAYAWARSRSLRAMVVLDEGAPTSSDQGKQTPLVEIPEPSKDIQGLASTNGQVAAPNGRQAPRSGEGQQAPPNKVHQAAASAKALLLERDS